MKKKKIVKLVNVQHPDDNITKDNKSNVLNIWSNNAVLEMNEDTTKYRVSRE